MLNPFWDRLDYLTVEMLEASVALEQMQNSRAIKGLIWHDVKAPIFTDDELSYIYDALAHLTDGEAHGINQYYGREKRDELVRRLDDYFNEL